jgi:RNA polymerase sigma factor (sigma-70 family)
MTVEERNQLVTENLGIAHAIVNHFAGWGHDREELRSIAYLAMVEAANTYDPGRGRKFSSWAWLMVEQTLNDSLRLGPSKSRTEPLDRLRSDSSIWNTEKGDEETSGEERLPSHLPTPEEALLAAEAEALLGKLPEGKVSCREAKRIYLRAYGELPPGKRLGGGTHVERQRRYEARMSPEKKEARTAWGRAWKRDYRRRARALGLPKGTSMRVVRAVEAGRS